MNIFWREIKSHLYSLLGWIVGMTFLIAAGMAKYAGFSSSGQSADQLLQQFPKTFLAIFGISGYDLNKAVGFYGILFIYVALMAAIHAALIGSDVISKEERDRTSEFLFAKPVSRSLALTAKLSAALINVLILNIMTSYISLKMVTYYAKGEPVGHTILLLMAGLLFIQLIFLSIGAALAGISSKPKTVSGSVTAALLSTYILFIFVNANQKLDWLKYFSPFKYFDAKEIMAVGKLSSTYLAISLLIIITATVLAYTAYQKRDLTV